VFTISTQIAVLEGFSPGDVSSIAAAVAAAHIGKPPPFHTLLVRDESTTTGTNMSRKFDVVGKAPTRKEISNRELPSLPVTAKIFEVDVHRHDLETILWVKQNDLDNFVSESPSTGKDTTCDKQILNHELDEYIPTVDAVFCGYRATFEEISRLRSAHDI
jgi:hypothetical protein